MSVTLPTLRLFSQGQHVKTLQSALNIWPQSKTPPLSADGILGPKTSSRVREYQVAHNLAADGIVGPLTWGVLQALVDEVLGLPVPGINNEELGKKIVATAERALSMWGWAGGQVSASKFSACIAAAICADATDPFRPRQGGGSLFMIFQGAGAAPAYVPRCMTISPEAVKKWQQTSSASTAWRNSFDLPAWCGIFCYYVYFAAGINLGGWLKHKANMTIDKKFVVINDPSKVMPGSIGVVDGIRSGGRNHHFIVTSNANGVMQSIDGNAWGPESPNDYSKGNRSVIKRGRYTYGDLKSQSAYFLFPDLARV